MNENQPFRELLKSARGELAYKIERLKININEQIIRAMEVEDVSKSELASLIDSSAPYITKVLRGETNFTLESIVKISNALKYDVEVKLVPRTDPLDWVDLFGKSVAPKREFCYQIMEDARSFRGGLVSVPCTSPSQYLHESH